jgi:glutathione S-transferase
MKLYYSPGACSLAPHIILRETRLAHSLIKVDLATHATEDGRKLSTINPKGSVPVLELETGELLTEGPVITQYLADQAGRTDLMPAAGSLARYRVMEWQNFVTSELHKSFSPLFNPAVDEKGRVVFADQLKKKFAWVSSQLEDRTYLTGESFTVADAYLFTVAGWGRIVDVDLSSFGALQGYLATVARRPAVREAMRVEGLGSR